MATKRLNTKKGQKMGPVTHAKWRAAYMRTMSAKRAGGSGKNPRRRANPKAVYDGAGKLVGKFSRKTAKMVARVVGGTVGKPKVNPHKGTVQLLFKSKAAAVKYAKSHGAKRYSVKKLARPRLHGLPLVHEGFRLARGRDDR